MLATLRAGPASNESQCQQLEQEANNARKRMAHIEKELKNAQEDVRFVEKWGRGRAKLFSPVAASSTTRKTCAHKSCAAFARTMPTKRKTHGLRMKMRERPAERPSRSGWKAS